MGTSDTSKSARITKPEATSPRPRKKTPKAEIRPPDVYIGERVQELARTLNVSQRALALMSGIDPEHFNYFWHNKRPAPLEIIQKVALGTNRSIAWMMGEHDARPVLGTVNAIGQITMAATILTSGLLAFVEASGPFAAGTRLMVDPSSTFAANAWIVLQQLDNYWVGWAYMLGEHPMIQRTDGESFRYIEGRHAVVGIVTGVISGPPPAPAL